MDKLARLEGDADGAIAALAGLPPRAAAAREMQRLRRDALAGSLALAGHGMPPEALTALLDRGVVVGTVPLASVLVARDLAAAAAWVSETRAFVPGDPRPLLSVDDLRRLHRLAAREEPGTAGIWRQTTLPPRADVIAPPPWMVPFETAAMLERLRRVPARGKARWLAGFLARAARVRPFPTANGRVARLGVDLALRRLGLPPLVVAAPVAPAYREALAAATAGRSEAFVAIVARALRDACVRLAAAAADEPLIALRDADPADYERLAKAARRGRLRTIERDGRRYTTATWLAAYRESRWQRVQPT